MSTNSECDFIEIKKNVWYYILENYDAPKNAWDWREYATCYGPFSSFDIANKYLSDNHANPGGYSMNELGKNDPDVNLEKDSTLKKLIENACSPQKAYRRYRY
jgi:hypothetical protein